MPVAHFASLPAEDTVEVVFTDPTGGTTPFTMLVDSGFTGQSAFVLPDTARALAHAPAASAQAMGALTGLQSRVVVECSVPALNFQTTAIAVLTDTTGLALPPGVSGMVGLRFLRFFRRWGAERDSTGVWRFFLET